MVEMESVMGIGDLGDFGVVKETFVYVVSMG